MSNFWCFRALNSAKNKKFKNLFQNFFRIPKNYLHANFQENLSKIEGAFQNPGQNPIFLSDFWLKFGSDDQPSNDCKI